MLYCAAIIKKKPKEPKSEHYVHQDVVHCTDNKYLKKNANRHSFGLFHFNK